MVLSLGRKLKSDEIDCNIILLNWKYYERNNMIQILASCNLAITSYLFREFLIHLNLVYQSTQRKEKQNKTKTNKNKNKNKNKKQKTKTKKTLQNKKQKKKFHMLFEITYILKRHTSEVFFDLFFREIVIYAERFVFR